MRMRGPHECSAIPPVQVSEAATVIPQLLQCMFYASLRCVLHQIWVDHDEIKDPLLHKASSFKGMRLAQCR